MFKWMSDLISGLKKSRSNGYSYRSGWDLGDRESQYGSLVAYTDVSGQVEAVGGWNSDSSTNQGVTAKLTKAIDERIEKKPVEVFQEIMGETPKMDVTNIDAQIKLVKRRQEMFKELGTPSYDEDEALIFLKARKAGIKQKTNFHWAPTTLSLCNDLVKKYKLAFVDFNSYAKNIPMEAIDELEAFLKEYAKVSDSKPVLKLIIDDAPAAPDKPSRERKKDPILLASSPFGKYFYILGAWDKEVEIVDGLIYHGK